MGNIALPSEKFGVAAIVHPNAITASTTVSAWVPVKNWPGGLMAIVMAGTLGASATLDAKLRQATDSSGTSAKDITGKAITQLTQAGSGSSKQAIIVLLPDQVDVAGGFTHVALSMTVGTATSGAGGIILGFLPAYGPATDLDLSSVAEVIF